MSPIVLLSRLIMISAMITYHRLRKLSQSLLSKPSNTAKRTAVMSGQPDTPRSSMVRASKNFSPHSVSVKQLHQRSRLLKRSQTKNLNTKSQSQKNSLLAKRSQPSRSNQTQKKSQLNRSSLTLRKSQLKKRSQQMLQRKMLRRRRKVSSEQ